MGVAATTTVTKTTIIIKAIAGPSLSQYTAGFA